MKKYIAIILILVCLFVSACADTSTQDGNGGAGSQTETEKPASPNNYPEDGNVRLTFAVAIDMERITELNGRTVEMIGYMATVSPVSGQ